MLDPFSVGGEEGFIVVYGVTLSEVYECPRWCHVSRVTHLVTASLQLSQLRAAVSSKCQLLFTASQSPEWRDISWLLLCWGLGRVQQTSVPSHCSCGPLQPRESLYSPSTGYNKVETIQGSLQSSWELRKYILLLSKATFYCNSSNFADTSFN